MQRRVSSGKLNMQYETFFDDLAKTVIFHRKKSGLNRVELALLAGVGKTVVFDIEHGKKQSKWKRL